MFRVVIVNHITAGLELRSGKDCAGICLLIIMLQSNALKISSL